MRVHTSQIKDEVSITESTSPNLNERFIPHCRHYIKYKDAKSELGFFASPINQLAIKLTAIVFKINRCQNRAIDLIASELTPLTHNGMN